MTLQSKAIAQHTAPLSEAFPVLQAIIDNGGPGRFDYPLMEFALKCLDEQESGADALVSRLIAACGFLKDKCSIMGHIRTRPYGYAGDFEIIEKIYQQTVMEERYRCWDTYALQHPAAQAVRNRKSYFLDLIRSRIVHGRELRLCNIASGPGRDLFEAFNGLRKGEQMRATCVEMDPNAIAYAAALNEPHAASIEFVGKNVFRFHTSERYDLIWSAGLFDYFEDATFVRLLRRMGTWMADGGEIVIGNFNACNNPSRTFMEVFGDWHLIHRSEQQLADLAQEAGFRAQQLSVGREQNDINLFLHIRNL